MTALLAERLTVRYPGSASNTPALADIDLSLAAGERLLLLGPNGAGKSTFLRVFAGLMRVTSGRARILGQPPTKVRRSIGVVSHATYLYEELTARENLRFYGQLYGVADAVTRSATLLSAVGLDRAADVRVGRLSRGQQQRAAIARALMHQPPVLLLDEPDSGLDSAAFGLLEGLITSSKQSVVLTTHNLAAGLRLGTRVAVLSRGRLAHEQPQVAAADAGPLSGLLERLARA